MQGPDIAPTILVIACFFVVEGQAVALDNSGLTKADINASYA